MGQKRKISINKKNWVDEFDQVTVVMVVVVVAALVVTCLFVFELIHSTKVRLELTKNSS